MLNRFKNLVGKKSKDEEHLEAYQKTLAQEPENLNVRLKLGDLYAKLERTEEAINEYTRVADQYAHEGYLVKAIAVNKIIVRLDPSREEALQRLSDLYFQRGVTADPLVQQYRNTHQEEPEEPEIPDEREEPPLPEQPEPSPDTAEAIPQETPLPAEEEAQEDTPDIPTIEASELLETPGEDLHDLDDSEFLKRVELFQDFAPNVRRKIADVMVPVTFKSGDTVITEGESGDCMYIVKSGEVGVYTILMQEDGISVIQSDQDRLNLATLHAGDFFGEQALITKEPRSATVIAETEVQLLKFTKRHLAQVVKHYPRVGKVLKQYHEERVKSMMESLKSLW